MSNELAGYYATPKVSFHEVMINKLLTQIEIGGLTLITESRKYFYGQAEHQFQAEIKITNNVFFSQLFWRGGIGLAESYLEGYWQTNNLTCVLQIFALNLAIVDKVDRSLAGGCLRFMAKVSHALNKNNIKGSNKNISKHYDLGNKFFALFLDPTMLYSCARFENNNFTLEQASLAKLKYICDKLELKPDDQVLEIGTGWGGFAIYAAQQYHCHVTTTTISKEQFAYTTAKVAELGLHDKIQVLLQDYRSLSGKYDKLVSIEMIEAVGHQYYHRYFQQCSNLLKQNGLFLLQAITIPEQRYKFARDSVDFIKLFIFPGGCVPSVGEILNSIRTKTDYTVVSIDDITLDYALTLNIWRHNFMTNYEQISTQGFDKTFIRKWLYYFSYCEAGFLERIIQDHQILFAKPNYRKLANVN
jgi:cyclopropane-fatty-acyl-phospholipid synthase